MIRISKKFAGLLTIGLVVLVVLFILVMTWFYPYSVFSLHKSYTFKRDPVVVEQYVADLDAFSDSYEKELGKLTYDDGKDIDLLIDRTQYILPLFEQDWLVSKEPVKIKKVDLEFMLFDVKNTRQSLMELLVQGDYTREQREYLSNSIEGLLSLEEEISALTSGKIETRKTVKIRLRNLHGAFTSNFMFFEIFYESVEDE